MTTTPSPTAFAVADIEAVRQFLASGHEIPRETRPGRPSARKAEVSVPVHRGITRARTRLHPAKA